MHCATPSTSTAKRDLYQECRLGSENWKQIHSKRARPHTPLQVDHDHCAYKVHRLADGTPFHRVELTMLFVSKHIMITVSVFPFHAVKS